MQVEPALHESASAMDERPAAIRAEASVATVPAEARPTDEALPLTSQGSRSPRLLSLRLTGTPGIGLARAASQLGRP